jgi:hypothetical protein
MRKIVGVILCLLFVVPSFIGTISVASQPQVLRVIATDIPDGDDDDEPEDVRYALPQGVTLRYRDNDDRTTEKPVAYDPDLPKNYIKHHGQYGAFYRTTGYLIFSLNSHAAVRVDDIEVTVKRKGVAGLDEDLPITVSDFTDDNDRIIFHWNYFSETHRAVGVYEISIEMGYSEPEDNDGDDGDFPIEEPDDDETFFYTLYSVCISSESNFGASFRRRNAMFNEGFRLAIDRTFETRARAKDSTFYWNDGVEIYAVPEDCKFLTVSADKKFMTLKTPKKVGEHTLTFFVTYHFVEVKFCECKEEDDCCEQDDKEVLVSVVLRQNEKVEIDMQFFKPRSQPDVWDVILMVAVLGALGGAAALVTKMAKGVENR